MPINQYACANDECGDERIERIEKLHEKELPPFCSKCGNRMVWAPTSMSFSLKGSDWPGKKIKMQRGRA